MTSIHRRALPTPGAHRLLSAVVLVLLLSAAAPPAVAGGPTVTAITAGYMHTCARTNDGGAWCWGWNGNGQLGDGTRISRGRAVRVTRAGGAALDDVVAISAGGYHTCARTSSGGAWCWGSDLTGQLGIGQTITDRLRAVRVTREGGAPLAGVVAISAGRYHSCAVTTGGHAWCWGWNHDGQLGDGTTTDRARAVRVTRAGGAALTGITAVSAGGDETGSHACAWASGGGAWCWGDNRKGQLGDGTTTDRHRAVRVTRDDGALVDDVTTVSAGGAHSCAVTNDRAAWCWGWNGDGQLGDGTRTERHGAVRVTRAGGSDLADVSRVDAGDDHSCASTSDLAAWCWGHNEEGQLGDGSTVSRRRAVRVTRAGLPGAGATPLVSVTGVTVGGSHTCARTRDGAAWCWGYAFFGQVGGEDTLSDNFYRAVPVVPTWAP